MKYLMFCAVTILSTSTAFANPFLSASRNGAVNEMKCVKKIVQDNIGGKNGYLFARNELIKTIRAFETKQPLSAINGACQQFIKSNGDKGFDSSGASLSYITDDRDDNRKDENLVCISKDETLLDDSVVSKVADHLLADLIYPVVTCFEGSLSGVLALDLGFDVDARTGMCETTDGGMFLREALGGGGTIGIGAGVGAAIGGGGSVASYIQAHKLFTTLKTNVGVAGLYAVVVKTEDSYVSSDYAAAETAGLGVGGGFIETYNNHGGSGSLQLPVSENSTAVLLSTFENDMAKLDPNCER